MKDFSHYQQLRDTIIIYYEWWTSANNGHMWIACVNGVVIDYHTKKTLIEMAKASKLKWMVLKIHKAAHKRGMVTVTEEG